MGSRPGSDCYPGIDPPGYSDQEHGGGRQNTHIHRYAENAHPAGQRYRIPVYIRESGFAFYQPEYRRKGTFMF
ncbi:MAG: hypothetical protein GX433_05650 [Deltaproteobacteria bacterium]|nr:hypothetical protein [Deltaproteobacteria bacterium]